MPIIIGGFTTSGSRPAETTYTVAHTAGAGTEVIIIFVNSRDPGLTVIPVLTLTYDGNNCTLGKAINMQPEDMGAEVWYYDAPVIGVSKDVIITHDGECNDNVATVLDISRVNMNNIKDIDDDFEAVNGDATLDFSAKAPGAVGFGACILQDINVSKISVSTGVEIVETDIGDRVTSHAYGLDDSIVFASTDGDQPIAAAGITVNARPVPSNFSGTTIKNWMFMKEAWEKHDKIWKPKPLTI